MTNEELNEAVARKLGWVKAEDHWVLGHDTGEKPMPRRKGIPYYSTSIEAAWEIINQFHETTVGTVLVETDCWFCEIRPQVGERIKEFAQTPMLAICKAFLKLP